MIAPAAFSGKKYAVIGLARSGLASAHCLLANGAKVTVWDEREDARNILAGKAEIDNPLDLDLTGYDGVIVSPGVPLNSHPISAHAARFNVPVIGDIELFAMARPSLPPHKVVGITGTNGKSTTTALITHILEQAGVPTLMGGNIGLPILGQEALPAGGVYVLELSSYQIDLTQSLDCEVACLLNITPDHLDRYASFEAYAASKGRLFQMQSEGHALVISASTKAAMDQLPKGRKNAVIIRADQSNLDQSNWPALQGPHNLENVLISRELCLALGLSEEAIEAGLRSYKSLPHRMERIGEFDGVLYVNDSKATNQASAAPALAAFPPEKSGAPRIHWIVGGVVKEKGLGECEAFLPHISAAYCIGSSAEQFAELLQGLVPVVCYAEDMENAVSLAQKAAKAGDVILLSPACASFDQYRDFEARGDHFRMIIAERFRGISGGDRTPS